MTQKDDSQCQKRVPGLALLKLGCLLTPTLLAGLAHATGLELDQSSNVRTIRLSNEVPISSAPPRPETAATAPSHPPLSQIKPLTLPPRKSTPQSMPRDGSRGFTTYDGTSGKLQRHAASDVLPASPVTRTRGRPAYAASGGTAAESPQGSLADMTLIENSYRDEHPWSMNVKLVINANGEYHTCSGTMLDARVISTSALCIWSLERGLASEVFAYPAWDGKGTPDNMSDHFGMAYSNNFTVPTEWEDAVSSGYYEWDYDVALIYTYRAVGMLTGWFGAVGGDCSTWGLSKNFNVVSYPQEDCGAGDGTHDGTDMWHRFGSFDACYQNQQYIAYSTSGCYSSGFEGERGGGAYVIESGERYQHALISDPFAEEIYFSTLYPDWISFAASTYIPNSRGTTFDLQALQLRADTEIVEAGKKVSTVHVLASPTDGYGAGDDHFVTYLLSTSPFLEYNPLAQYPILTSPAPMTIFSVGAEVTIPDTTLPGQYYLGVHWGSNSDAIDAWSDYWDAAPIEVVWNNTFDDVPPYHWAYDWIEELATQGITSGCTSTSYCPEAQISRAQMAIFLLRSKHGAAYVPPPATGTMFSDVPASFWAARWIEQLANEEITTGCGGGRYCPYTPVSRDQMAIFLLKTKYGSGYLPPAATGVFSDVPSNYWAASWIEQLYSEGITGGCSTSPLAYCPTDAASRAQMAVFLLRTFFSSSLPEPAESPYPEGEHPAVEGIPRGESDI